MKLSREEAIKLHRELWGWLAENPMKTKTNWSGWEEHGKIQHDCFCCEYGQVNKTRACNCPLIWPNATKNYCACEQSYYIEWARATAPEERSRLAALIRDLPEKQSGKPEPQFKVGQWVKVLVENYNFGEGCTLVDRKILPTLPWARPVKGNCYEVIVVSNKQHDRYGFIYALKSQYNTICFMHNNYIDGEVASDGLELTEPPKPAPKYQVGDKVVPIIKSIWGGLHESNAWRRAKDKQQGYLFVREINPMTSSGPADYLCDDTIPTKHGGDFFLESDLIPYVEPSNFKFAVGDKVRAIAASEGNGWGGVKKGDVGVITHTPENHPCKNRGEYYADRYRATFPNQNDWDGKEECFEHVVSEPKPEVKSEPEKEESKPAFKVGDRVICNASQRAGKSGIVRGVDCGLISVEYPEKLPFNSNAWDNLYPDKAGYGWLESPNWLEIISPINYCPEPKTLTSSTTFIFKGNKTTCIIDIDGRKFKGVAKCDPKDEWNEDIGRQWAELRANRKMIDAVERELKGQHNEQN